MPQQFSAIKAGGDSEDPIFERHPGIICVAGNADAAAAFTTGVIGETAWLFARSEMADSLDYLFVDEAGQISLANLAGMCHVARNIVLVGDQMQLRIEAEISGGRNKCQVSFAETGLRVLCIKET